MKAMREPSSRKIIIITSCCLFATVSFLYKAQYYVLDFTQQPIAETADDSLDYDVHEEEGLGNKSSWSELYDKYTQYTKEQQTLLSSSHADDDASLQSSHHNIQNSNSSIKEEKIANNRRTGREGHDVLYWNELTNDAQVAAQKLGYSQQSWDNLRFQKPPQRKKPSTMPMITRPTNGSPPLFNLPQHQALCKLNSFEVVCFNATRNISIESYPLFAEYYIDGDGTRVMSNNRTQSSSSITQHKQRPIATSWFQPNITKFCGNFTDDQPCANLGDELGPMLLLKLSGADYIENRYDGMDVVIIGSVLNFLTKKYNKSVAKVGNYYNVTVWGTGTKWKTKGVCFDYRAVRGPLTRNKLLQQGCNVPEVYGDAALLFPYIYKPNKLSLPLADLCLVPHLGDLADNFPWWSDLNRTSLIPRFTHFDHHTTTSNNNNQTIIRVIDIRTPNAAAFIDTMMTCKLVASASLHGMILAEAYNLTWSWIRLRDKSEDPFKYHDFFESVGISKGDVRPLQLQPKDPIDKIIEHTMKPKMRHASLFDPVKLLDACPFCDTEIVNSIKASIEEG